MATTVERPPVERELESVHRTNRWLAAAVVVLVIAVVALGAWVVYDLTTSDQAGPSEVRSLVDDYITSWSDYDSEAFLGAVDQASYEFVYGSSTYGAGGIVGSIEGMWQSEGWKAEQIGDMAVVQIGDMYYVASPMLLTTTANPEGVEGLSVIRVIDFPERGYKVTYHEYFGMAP